MEGASSSSAMVSGPSKASFLQGMLERLSSSPSLTLQTEGDEEAPVAVVSLQRYFSHQQQQNYNYDLTVTDGVWRAKCLLHPSLNPLVHTNTLRSGHDILITRCSFVYCETRLGHGCLCIEELRCDGHGSAVLSSGLDVTALPVLVKQGMQLMEGDVPLQPGSKHYLSLWNNDDPEGDMWRSGCSSSDTVQDVSRVTPLCSLETSFRNIRTPPPLLVKILHKSRLRYYGKCGLKIDFPYQAYFEVADQSGSISLVLWNELCPEFYRRLNVGSVLYLQNYTLKKSYSNRSRPQMDNYRLKTFDSIEICLNARNPSAIITMVSPKSVLPQWGLPDVSHQFITRSDLDKLPNNSACDVIALVTFVGRVERVKSQSNRGPEKYWTYRWIHAVDGTSEQPFILELFSSSQVEIFSSICPMTYLVCTQMRVCQVEGSVPYLTSSCETETFITGYHKGQPYVSDPTVKSFIQWAKVQKEQDLIQKTAVGGYYCYPRPPRTFTQTVADTSVPLVAAVDLKKELESLQYRERKKLAIQGQITAVQFMERPKSLESKSAEENEVSTDVCEDAVPDPHSSSSTAEQEDGLPSSSSDSRSEQKQRREILKETAAQSLLTFGQPSAKRRLLYKHPEGKGNDQGSESVFEEVQHVEEGPKRPNPRDPSAFSWESGSWPTQRQEVCEHLRQGGFYPESVHREFTFDRKDVLLQWSNLQPMRWTSERNNGATPPAASSGYYQVTILGINQRVAIDAAYFPVVNSSEPRAVGLPQDPHGNTMMSCLSSGFLCPLRDASNHSQADLPQPDEVLASAVELEDEHVVCILDLCHLGGDKVEVLINKVYKVNEISLN